MHVYAKLEGQTFNLKLISEQHIRSVKESLLH